MDVQFKTMMEKIWRLINDPRTDLRTLLKLQCLMITIADETEERLERKGEQLAEIERRLAEISDCLPQ